MNYIVYEGIRRYGFDELSYELALRSVKLFMGEWLKNSHYHENYNAETGEGDGILNSDPYYSWGALLALMGLEELINIDEGGIRFGSLAVRDVNEVNNYSIGNDSYSIKVGPSILEAYRNGKLFLKANKAIVVSNYRRSVNYVEFNVKGHGAVSVIEFNPNKHALVCINEECSEAVTDNNGALNLNIEFKEGRMKHVVIVAYGK